MKNVLNPAFFGTISQVDIIFIGDINNIIDSGLKDSFKLEFYLQNPKQEVIIKNHFAKNELFILNNTSNFLAKVLQPP